MFVDFCLYMYAFASFYVCEIKILFYFILFTVFTLMQNDPNLIQPTKHISHEKIYLSKSKTTSKK